MKLLLDANLSYRIVASVDDVFPGTLHVRQVALMEASDDAIWRYARANDFVIVTLDSDFYDLSSLRGFPPKIVWLRLGNTSTETIVSLLRGQARHIEEFGFDDASACLIVHTGGSR